ncbi:hypothetical protein GOV06_04155 [Candidatus Woesearchaeota archaeon]|nr:hypothetical protein [Candidatus Woesearchaeota archaeon]
MTINKGKTNEELVQKYLARKKAREEKPIEEPLEEKVERKDSLVYAVDDIIFLFRVGQEDMEITRKRMDIVNALCVYKGILFDAGADRNIYDTLADFPLRTFDGIVLERPGAIHSLCSHKDILLDSGDYHGIYTLATGLKPEEVLNAVEDGTQDKKVLALCSHYNQLFHIEEGVYLYRTIGHQFSCQMEPRESAVTHLCSHNEGLYYADEKSIYQTLAGKKIAEREGEVRALCSHNGELYDGGEYGLCKTLSGINIPLKFSNSEVSAMCSIPQELANNIIHKCIERDMPLF